MKKFLKIFAILISLLFVIVVFSFCYYFIVASKYKINEEKLNVSSGYLTTFLDNNGEELKNFSTSQNVSFKDLPENLVNAFVAIEDKRFYSHKGVDLKGIVRALINNIKSFSFKEGASTITQQLVKNTHLNSEKTINRKIAEISLSKKIERKYSKNQIMEMYLNSIYFGDNKYGIYSASKHYFDKEPIELNLNECATLAGIVKSPLNYSPSKNPKKSFNRKNVVLKEMLKQGYITKNDYDFYTTQEVKISESFSNSNKFNVLLFKELDEILENKNIKNAKIKIYTTINPEYQENIENALENHVGFCDAKSIVLIDKFGGIKAYSSNVGEVYRQMGSVIKPILVYAPAFDKGIINESTIIDDTMTSFDGYVPKNYNNRYLGKITAKKALSVSSNTCSVKILNSTGVSNAKKTIKNIDLNLTDKDNFLNLAVGSSEKGATLTQITSSYTTFLNNGYYYKPYIIERIIDSNNKVLYQAPKKGIKIFKDSTCFLINDCLNNTVKEGTAKKLKEVSENLCSKTGTVGNSNGNMDAYSITYDKKIISSVWLGNANGSLMKNNVTGGTIPTEINKEIFSSIYNEEGICEFFSKPDSVSENYLDKISLENDYVEELSDKFSPEEYKIKYYFSKSKVPKNISNRFTTPKIEKINYSLNNNVFSMQLCETYLCDFKVYVKHNDIETLLFDTKNKKNKLDYELKDKTEYIFYAVPYFNNVKGEIYVIAKIKSPEFNSSDWWIE